MRKIRGRSRANHSRRDAYCHCIIRNVPCDYRPGSDESVLAYLHARVDSAPGSNRRETLHSRIEPSPLPMCSWTFVVCESHIWSDEHIVLYDDPGGDEDEGPNLTIVSNRDSFLDIDERIYFRILSYLTAVEVNLI